MRGKFSFLYVDIWFDVTKCKFIVKNSSFKMLIVFLLIFVADTKITLVYNFVAPLKLHRYNGNMETLIVIKNDITKKLMMTQIKMYKS